MNRIIWSVLDHIVAFDGLSSYELGKWLIDPLKSSLEKNFKKVIIYFFADTSLSMYKIFFYKSQFQKISRSFCGQN